MWNSLKRLHRLSLCLLDCFLAQNEHITVSPGPSAWRAMLADRLHQMSRSSSSGYQKPLLLPSVFTLPEDGSNSLSWTRKLSCSFALTHFALSCVLVALS